jgi:hypothetical protein
VHRVFPVQQCLHRKQAQNDKCQSPHFAICQCRPRQHSQQDVHTQRNGQTVQLAVPSLSLGISLAGFRSAHTHNTAQHWCTGEDSNLRSSQGAADLQSAAINHSATCAIPLLLASPSLPRTIAELALTSLHASVGAQRKIIRRRVNILPHKGSLHVGRIPLRSAFLVILLR